MTDGDVHPGEMPDELDSFLDDLRSAAAETPAPLTGDALMTLFRDGAAPVVAPLRRRWAVRAVVAGAVGGLAFGGLGVAGALPHPVQQRVADVADYVGVHLPDSRPAVTTTTVPPTTETTSTTTAPTAVPPPRRPAATPTTVDNHDKGGNDDPSGNGDTSGDDRSGDDRSGTDPSGSGDSSKGADDNKDQSDDAVKPSDEGSGRIPDATVDVHLPEGSDRSSHDDEGRSQ
jgi:hypothetical protein